MAGSFFETPPPQPTPPPQQVVVDDAQGGIPEHVAAEIVPITSYGRRERVDIFNDDKWQTKIRTYDRDGPGIFGASLDLPAATSMLLELVVRKRTPAGYEIVRDSPELSALLALWSGRTVNQQTLFSRLIRTLGGPGEGYLNVRGMNRPHGVANPEKIWWDLAQATNVSDNRDGTTSIVKRRNARTGDRWHAVVDNKWIYHVLMSDPEFEGEAWSPSRRAVPHLEQYRQAMRNISRNLDSQLAMNGILWAKEIGEKVTWPDRIRSWASRAIKDDDDVASVMPFPMTTPEPPTWIDVGRGSHADQIQVAELFLKAFAQSSDLPTQMLLEGPGQGNHWCMPTTTEAFARGRGWVPHTSLKVGDEILALDHETGAAVWSPMVDKYVADVVDEPMLDLEHGKSHSSLSTMRHRWPVVTKDGNRAWRTSETLKASDHIVLAAPHTGLPVTETHSDSFVELIGWYTTEGTCTYKNGKPCQIRIGQSHARNPERCVELRRVLTDVFGSAYTAGSPPDGPGWTETAEDRGITIFRLNAAARDVLLAAVPGRDKTVPLEVVDTFTLKQLLLFLDAVVLADGTQHGKSRVLAQAVKARLDSIEYAANLAGVATTVRERVRGENSFSPRSTFWELTLKDRTVAMPLASKRADDPYPTSRFTGTIWCPKTEHGTWFARHNGRSFFTGNSAYLEGDFYADMVMAPRWQRACSIITETHLRPFMRAASGVFSGFDPDDYEVWCLDDRIRRKTDNTDRLFEARRMGAIQAQPIADALGIPVDQVMKLPAEMTDYDQWLIANGHTPATGPGDDAPDVVNEPDRDRLEQDFNRRLGRGPTQPPDTMEAQADMLGELLDGDGPDPAYWNDLVPT